MRRFIYICFCLLMIACSKESTLESRINLDELYVIQDDPDDPVKHRIYEIYETYGIPVYFNDTIGRIFLKTDVHGQPVYQYEKLDLAWGYDSYEKLEYHYQYITDPEKQLEVLTWIGQYLRDADKALFPFCFFVPESVTTKNLDNREVTELDQQFMIGFRTLTMIMGNWEGENPGDILLNMKRNMVTQKIKNYSEDLAYFNKVSDANWYGTKYWSEVDNTITTYWNCDVLNPDYTGSLTGEALEEQRVEARAVTGRFGFVMGDEWGGGLFTPYDTQRDLECFVKVILATGSDEVFREQWCTYPLVMEKYDVLYEIITEKLGVEL